MNFALMHLRNRCTFASILPAPASSVLLCTVHCECALCNVHCEAQHCALCTAAQCSNQVHSFLHTPHTASSLACASLDVHCAVCVTFQNVQFLSFGKVFGFLVNFETVKLLSNKNIKVWC